MLTPRGMVDFTVGNANGFAQRSRDQLQRVWFLERIAPLAPFGGLDGFKVHNKASEPRNYPLATILGLRDPETCLRNGFFHLLR